MHIGLIGGIGPAATTYYYQQLLRNGSDIDLTIAHAEIAILLKNQNTDAPQAQAEVFAHHIHQLKAAGAEMAAVTSVAGHFCHEELARVSDLPLVNIIDCLNDRLRSDGIKRVGMIGSPVGMRTRLFGAITAAEVLVPEGDALPRVGNAYSEMAHRGAARAGDAELFFEAGQELSSRGAEAVLLGGTDLFLVFDDADPGYPVLDAAKIHCARLGKLLRS